MESTPRREGPGKGSQERLLEGLPPLPAPPSLPSSCQEPELTVDAPDPGRCFDFVPPGFPLALFTPGAEAGSYCFLLLNGEVAS